MFSSMSISESLEMILKQIRPIGVMSVQLHDACNTLLAQDVVAKYDVPDTNISNIYGYGIKYIDIEHATDKYPSILSIAHDGIMLPGKALYVEEGDNIADEVDCVLPLHSAVLLNDNEIEINKSIEKQSNISFAGGFIKANEIIIKMGNWLTPSIISYIAKSGIEKVEIYPRIRITIINYIIDNDRSATIDIRYQALAFLLYDLLKALNVHVKKVDIYVQSIDEMREVINSYTGSTDMFISMISYVNQSLNFNLEEFLAMEYIKLNIIPDIRLGFTILKDSDIPFLFIYNSPLSIYLLQELLIRPIIHQMCGIKNISRIKTKAKLLNDNFNVDIHYDNLLLGYYKNYQYGLGVYCWPINVYNFMDIHKSNCIVKMPINMQIVEKNSFVNITVTDV